LPLQQEVNVGQLGTTNGADPAAGNARKVGGVALMVIGLIFVCVGGLLGAFGALYILAAHAEDAINPAARLTTGIVMVVVGLLIWSGAALGAFLAWRRMQPKAAQKVTIHQEVELTGDIDLASLSCEKCGASLDRDAITVREGAIFVSCPYCGATYQVVEEPKW
jgi:Na+/H+ antiporter NhaC